MPDTNIKHDEYTSDDIQVLEGLEAVRKRPGMYIGTTSDAGLHHLIWEIVDNSVDEALAGYAHSIEITVDNNDIVTVKDDGRGMPVEIHKKTGISTVETIFTVLHAGGKFGGGAYKVSGGLHGVGVSCVNALSCYLEATVYRDGNIYKQIYHRGIPEEDVKIVGHCDPEKHGTTISFSPDFEVMENNSFNYETLSNRFRELSFLNHGIRITIVDKRQEEEKTESFHSEGGLNEFVSYLNEYKKTLFAPISFEAVKDDVVVEIALQYNDKYDEKVYSFVNNINTREGGTHLTGFKTAVLMAVNNQLSKNAKMLKKFGNDKLESADISEGLTGVVSIKIPNPQFEGQTKMKLGNANVRFIVQSLVYEKLNNYFDEFPGDIELLLDKAISAALGRIAARKAREQIRKKSEGGGLPGKLADCS